MWAFVRSSHSGAIADQRANFVALGRRSFPKTTRHAAVGGFYGSMQTHSNLRPASGSSPVRTSNIPAIPPQRSTFSVESVGLTRAELRQIVLEQLG